MADGKLTKYQSFVQDSLVKLGPRAREVAEYVMEHPKAQQKEIAKALGISPQRVSQIVRNDRYLSALPGLARRELKAYVPQAIRRFKELGEQNENLEVSRKVVERALDTAKVLESEPKIQINVFQNMKNDELARIVDQSKPTIQDIVDVDLVDEHGK
jgi:DNA-binding CsgD family transcriptional regulator